jgi:hypothetical protein
MPAKVPPIIADAAPAPRLARGVFAAAVLIGAGAALVYASQSLTLSHYDARAHLVVARRVFDSLTPGWRQLGGVWLPLPHLLNLLPVAWDFDFRTGASAVAISILSLALGLGWLARYVHRRTGSVAAALAAPAVILLNPDVLYLQSTPMTEPLLLGASLAAVTAIEEWMADPRGRAGRVAPWLLAALMLIRYEGWFVAAGLVVLAVFSRASARDRRSILRLVWPPAAAVAAFLILAWASTGRLLVTSGFFVPENPTEHHPLDALRQVWNGTRDLAGWPLVITGAIGMVACVRAAVQQRSLSRLVPLALLLAALLPVSAFDHGHPYRVRYMVPMVAALGVLTGLALSWVPARARTACAVLFALAAIVSRPPLDAHAPMVVEAQRESVTRAQRRAVTAYLASHYDGQPILASMDSLGHYMQETSAIGINLRHFVHEGNGDLWIDALATPQRHVGWVLIETLADGGDQLFHRATDDPRWLAGFTRVAEGGGAVLYAKSR